MTGSERSAAGDIALIARREFRERGRDKSFVISSVVTMAIIVAIVVLPAIFSNPPTYKLGVVGAQAQQIADATKEAATANGVEATISPLPDEAAARAAVTAGAVDIAIVGEGRAISNDKLKPEIAAVLAEASRNLQLTGRLTTAGLSPAQAQAALAQPPVQFETLKPKSKEDGTRQGIAFLTVIVLYGQLLGYAMWVAMGVVEEKSSRVIEVLAATVRPRRLMTGKVVGIGGLALLQLTAVTIVSIAAAVTVGRTTIPADAFGSIAMSFVWFLVGFTFFAFLFAGAASLVSRQEDLQNVTTPMTLVMIGSLFAGINASSNPDSPLAQVLSFVPPVSSVVMPPRLAAGNVPMWQAAASFALMLLATYGVVRLSGRVYSASILRAKSKWREALRSGRASG